MDEETGSDPGLEAPGGQPPEVNPGAADAGNEPGPEHLSDFSALKAGMTISDGAGRTFAVTDDFLRKYGGIIHEGPKLKSEFSTYKKQVETQFDDAVRAEVQRLMGIADPKASDPEGDDDEDRPVTLKELREMRARETEESEAADWADESEAIATRFTQLKEKYPLVHPGILSMELAGLRAEGKTTRSQRLAKIETIMADEDARVRGLIKPEHLPDTLRDSIVSAAEAKRKASPPSPSVGATAHADSEGDMVALARDYARRGDKEGWAKMLADRKAQLTGG